MPAGIYNRAADNWRPLLAIAEVAGGDWLARGQAAALASVAADIDDASRLELLLGDIRDAFTTDKATKVRDTMFGAEQTEIPSAELVEALVALDGRPWAEMGKSRKPITQNRLARMLKPLGSRRTEGRTGRRTRQRLRPCPLQGGLCALSAPEGVSQPDSRTEADEMRHFLHFHNRTAQKPAVRLENARNPITTGLCPDVQLQRGSLAKSAKSAPTAASPGGDEVSLVTAGRRGSTANAGRPSAQR